MITHENKRTLAELSSTGSSVKTLCLISWNGNPAKLDLRIWLTDKDPIQPGRGITLTDAEARTLLDALQEYFDTP